MEKINWGIIGCGDVTEVKSGPAFNKVNHSSLIAVMRRDGEKAKDYAKRHHVPKWYDDAYKLINDPEINAIYVATPPSSHEEYTLAALKAGKPVYVEKPMALDYSSAVSMKEMAEKMGVKLVVAHYRRMQPLFNRVKQLLAEKAIGETRFARMEFLKKPLSKEELDVPKTSWRVDKAISGGGLFHDLAPHQLDLMLYYFGDITSAYGISYNQAHIYNADDIVGGNILFKSGVLFNGLWCFNVGEEQERDICEIIGSGGSIQFSVFGDPKITIQRKDDTEIISFDSLEHVQQPMIEKVVEYFLDEGPNPCCAADGVEVMKLLEEFTSSI